MRTLIKILYMFVMSAMIFSCEKDDSSPKDNTPSTPGRSTALNIASVSPSSATVGTKVVIIGTGFSSIPSENIIKFGDKVAVTDSATTTRLVTKVPEGSTTGKVSVSVKQGTVASTSDITIVNTPAGGAASGQLLVHLRSHISCVDVKNRAVKWKYNTNNLEVESTIRVVNDLVLASLRSQDNLTKEVVALDLKTGSKRWSYMVEVASAGSSELTDVHSAGTVAIFCTRVAYSGVISVYAVNLSDGKLKWNKTFPADNFTRTNYIRAIDNKVFVVTRNGLQALNSENGNAIWNSGTQSLIPSEFGMLQIAKNAVIFLDNKRRFVSLDLSTGKFIWRSEGEYSWSTCLVSGSRMVVAEGSFGENLKVLSLSDGKLERDLKFSGEYLTVYKDLLYSISPSTNALKVVVDASNGNSTNLNMPFSFSYLQVNNEIYELSNDGINIRSVKGTAISNTEKTVILDPSGNRGYFISQITYVGDDGTVTYPIRNNATYY